MGCARIGRGVTAGAVWAACALSFPLIAMAQSSAPQRAESDWLPVMPAPRHVASASPAPYVPGAGSQASSPQAFAPRITSPLPADPQAGAQSADPRPAAPENGVAKAAPGPSRKPDPQTKAYLFGAAYAKSDLSTERGGGMMFLPGRGLIRWETHGKTPAEQEELKTEAIGLADARAVQAQIDAQKNAMEFERQRANDAMAEHAHMGFAADARTVPALALNPVTGTRRQAGGVVPLNRAAQVAGMLGVSDGAAGQPSRRTLRRRRLDRGWHGFGPGDSRGPSGCPGTRRHHRPERPADPG